MKFPAKAFRHAAWAALLCWGLAASAVQAGVLIDWNQWEMGKTFGVLTDGKGTKIEASSAAGPRDSEKALKVSASLGEWGSVWREVKADLSRGTALCFKAKVSAPALLEVDLIDSKNVRYVCKVRVVREDWEEFVLPLADFKPTMYPLPGAPKTAPLDLKHIERIQFNPWTPGTTTYWIAPVSLVSGAVKAQTGMPPLSVQKGLLTVQDFVLMDKRAFGIFGDKKTAADLRFDVERDPETRGGWTAHMRYAMEGKGWGGVWMRCGADWGGQDWRNAKSIQMTCDCQEPILVQLGFNDRNQNAYVAFANLVPAKDGKGWATVEVPMKDFKLNPDYQPKERRKGAAQDLSRIETVNLAPLTSGKHDFRLKEILIRK